MKTQNGERRVRPMVVVLLGCLLGTILIPIWISTRPAPAPEPAEEAPQAATPAPVVAAKKQMVMPTRVRPPRRTKFAQQAKVEKPAPPVAPPNLEDRWGIQVCSVQLSMMNSMVDLRYKVIDPEKVVQLANGKTRAYIVDSATGTKFVMPTPPKEGAFPPTAHRLTAGKTYFAAVSNQRGTLKSGSVVSVLIGNSLATNLTVQ